MKMLLRETGEELRRRQAANEDPKDPPESPTPLASSGGLDLPFRDLDRLHAEDPFYQIGLSTSVTEPPFDSGEFAFDF
jgi:hypothetical protein